MKNSAWFILVLLLPWTFSMMVPAEEQKNSTDPPVEPGTTTDRDISVDADADPPVIPEAIRKSIRLGQNYLKSSQRPDGSFGGRSAYTALSTLALMVDGSTPGNGPFGKEVARGMQSLLDISEPTGLITGKSGNMYDHGLSTLCLAEIWGMTGNKKIRPVLKRAVELIIRTQNLQGGWRYQPRPKEADLSVTVMQIVALRASENAGIAVPEKTMQDAIKYVKASYNPKYKGFSYTVQTRKGVLMYSYGSRVAPARSAAGVISLQICGSYDAKEVKGGIEYLWDNLKAVEKRNKSFFYFHYYAMQSMYQARDSKKWNVWYTKACKQLMKKQNKKNGSFGSHHGTPMAILAMGLPYRYLPIYQR